MTRAHCYRTVPRPWTYEYDYATDTGASAWITGPNGELIVEEPGPEAGPDDLEHIVRCVNAHDDLLEAAREMANYFEDTVRDYLGDDPDEWECYTRLRAAIRKAEGRDR